jgi:hypothetical protein
MKKEIHPGLVAAVLVVVVALIVFVGYKLMTPTYNKDTSGSERDIERVKQGEAFYTPPKEALAGSTPAGGGMMYTPPPGTGVQGGGYNLQPPPR